MLLKPIISGNTYDPKGSPARTPLFMDEDCHDRLKMRSPKLVKSLIHGKRICDFTILLVVIRFSNKLIIIIYVEEKRS